MRWPSGSTWPAGGAPAESDRAGRPTSSRCRRTAATASRPTSCSAGAGCRSTTTTATPCTSPTRSWAAVPRPRLFQEIREERGLAYSVYSGSVVVLRRRPARRLRRHVPGRSRRAARRARPRAAQPSSTAGSPTRSSASPSATWRRDRARPGGLRQPHGPPRPVRLSTGDGHQHRRAARAAPCRHRRRRRARARHGPGAAPVGGRRRTRRRPIAGRRGLICRASFSGGRTGCRCASGGRGRHRLVGRRPRPAGRIRHRRGSGHGPTVPTPAHRDDACSGLGPAAVAYSSGHDDSRRCVRGRRAHGQHGVCCRRFGWRCSSWWPRSTRTTRASTCTRSPGCRRP